MARAKKNTLESVPYDDKGSMMNYVGTWQQPAEWRPNEPFRATLRLLDYNAGTQSGKNWILHSPNNPGDTRRWYMFASDVVDLMHNYPFPVVNATYTGLWLARKQGSNYGIYFHGTSGTTYA